MYYRPLSETFHDFLEFLAVQSLGDSWWKKQANPPHILVRYAEEYNVRKKEESLIDVCKEPDGSMSAIPTGPNLFWLLFCYDLFIIRNNNNLSDELIQRLKDRRHFQGARYELAIAAIFLRAGFDINWIKKDVNQTCEFEAIHRKTGIKVEVEAKSKIRRGVLHEPIGPKSRQGISKLLKDALKKKSTAEIPMIICIDVNLCFTSESYRNKPILNEVKRAIGTLSQGKDGFNLLMVTSFPFHYDNFDKVADPPESIIVLPLNNEWLHPDVYADLERSLDTYSIIPEAI